MLRELRVKNLAVIEQEEILFGQGLNILTGETGAGKSLLLGSIEWILKGTSDRSLIRSGAQSALIELTFSCGGDEFPDRLKDEGIYPEDGYLTISRHLREGRSVTRINGEQISAKAAAQAAAFLLDVHGQDDSALLRRAERQTEILDAYAGGELAAWKEKTGHAFRAYRKAQSELDALVTDEKERARRLSLIRYEIDEITGANLTEGEDADLERTYQIMQNAKKIAEGAACAREFLYAEGGAVDQLGFALRELGKVSSFDTELEELESGLRDAEALASEAAGDLSRYLDHLSFPEEEFAKVEMRLNEINRLKERYGDTIPEILAYLKEQEEEEEKLLHFEEHLSELRGEAEGRWKELLLGAEKVSGLRRLAAEKFVPEVERELSDLNLAACGFQVAFDRSEHIRSDGFDIIRFRVALNPGEEAGDLSQVASGGELSRIMLAIRTVLSGRDSVPTVIFDEIDAGISGRTAQKVAEKLKKISHDRQVICITHLAQIAAMADHHFVIEKSTSGNRTHTNVREAEGEDSIRELARILGGKEITETVLASAREMKKLGGKE